MKSSGNSSNPSHAGSNTPPRKRFALTGVSRAFDPATTAIRPDIADIRVADRYFAPHYAAPMTFAIRRAAPLTAERCGGAEVGQLAAGDSFEALEIISGCAWGIARPTGLVGYVSLDALGDAS